VSAHLDKDVFYLPTLFRPLQCWALDLMLDLLLQLGTGSIADICWAGRPSAVHLSALPLPLAASSESAVGGWGRGTHGGGGGFCRPAMLGG
jgi:hypothetical protein